MKAMSELDDLKKPVAELKNQIDPPPRSPSTHRPYDPTEGFSMPASAMRAMVDAIPGLQAKSNVAAVGLNLSRLKAHPASNTSTYFSIKRIAWTAQSWR
jgi:hypothetical protein